MKLKCVLVNVLKQTITKETYDKLDLDDLYDILNCSSITCVRRLIGGHVVDIYCDEEALLKENQIPAIFSNRTREIIFGNCLLVKHDREGEVATLTHKQANDIVGMATQIRFGNRVYTCLPTDV